MRKFDLWVHMDNSETYTITIESTASNVAELMPMLLRKIINNTSVVFLSSEDFRSMVIPDVNKISFISAAFAK
jgi:hypothetical protein